MDEHTNSFGTGKELRSGKLGTATFSDCYKYRYSLHRPLSDLPGQVVWIMLNPSTATEEANDPTVYKCCGYTEREGFGSAVVVNLFSLRSTDPRALKNAVSAGINPVGVGLENDNYIVNIANESNMVVCAWGRHGDFMERGRYVTSLLLLNGLSNKLHYLKLLTDKTPGHPLYLKNNLRPQPWKDARKYATECRI